MLLVSNNPSPHPLPESLTAEGTHDVSFLERCSVTRVFAYDACVLKTPELNRSARCRLNSSVLTLFKQTS
jgi:hypothetical protein